MRQYNDSRIKFNQSKERLFIAANRSRGNIITNREATKTKKQKWEEKQLCGYLKQQNSDIVHKRTWTWLRKWNPKSETEFQLIITQNNTIRTYYV